jgi:hypothetical protein
VVESDNVNDRGEVLGLGVLPTGDQRAFLLIPCDDDRHDDGSCEHDGGTAVDITQASPAGAFASGISSRQSRTLFKRGPSFLGRLVRDNRVAAAPLRPMD